MKRTLLAVLAVFLAWSALDIVLHGTLLEPFYALIPQLWRPMAEMKSELIYLVVLVEAATFVFIYSLISERSIKKGVEYGFLFGIGTGVSMGFGSYAVMPLPQIIAMGWFLGALVKGIVAGWITGLILKKRVEKSNWVPFGIRERGDYIK